MPTLDGDFVEIHCNGQVTKLTEKQFEEALKSAKKGVDRFIDCLHEIRKRKGDELFTEETIREAIETYGGE